ncbi:MAG: hypothetical protein L3J47_09990 [Sulfurovum sp.]|nr:hypothetical protein [Sulfurovum sp.]
MRDKIARLMLAALFETVGFLIIMLYIFISPIVTALLLLSIDVPQQLWLFIATELLVLLVPLFLWLQINKCQPTLYES